jgi:hypothetical protein
MIPLRRRGNLRLQVADFVIANFDMAFQCRCTGDASLRLKIGPGPDDARSRDDDGVG